MHHRSHRSATNWKKCGQWPVPGAAQGHFFLQGITPEHRIRMIRICWNPKQNIYIYIQGSRFKKQTLNMEYGSLLLNSVCWFSFFWFHLAASRFGCSPLCSNRGVVPPLFGLLIFDFKPSLQQNNMFKKRMAKSCKKPHPKSIHWHQ